MQQERAEKKEAQKALLAATPTSQAQAIDNAKVPLCYPSIFPSPFEVKLVIRTARDTIIVNYKCLNAWPEH